MGRGEPDAYRSSSSVSIYVEGANGSSGGQQASTGQWRIFTPDTRVILELTEAAAAPVQGELTSQDGKTFLNGSRVFVTAP